MIGSYLGRRRLRPRATRWHRLEWLIFLAVLGAISLWVWLHPPSALQLALFREELRVALVVDSGVGISPAVDASRREVYRDPTLAFERELFQQFANTIGTRLKIVEVASPDEARELLKRRQVDAAGGLLLPNPELSIGVRNGPEIVPLNQVLVAWNPVPGRPFMSSPDSPQRIGIVRGMPTAALSDHLGEADDEPTPQISFDDGAAHTAEVPVAASVEAAESVSRPAPAPTSGPTTDATPYPGFGLSLTPLIEGSIAAAASFFGTASPLNSATAAEDAAPSDNGAKPGGDAGAANDGGLRTSEDLTASSNAVASAATEPEPGVTRHHYANTQELVTALQGGLIDVALLHSVEYRNLKRDVPELVQVAELRETGAVWWFSSSFDDSLAKAAEQLVQGLRDSGELDRLIDRFFGHLDIHGLIDTLTLQRHVQTRLPPLLGSFIAAAEQHGLDWRLLAALGYQESQWDPNAVSPTGVRGVMMLTRATAAELGVRDRRDPEQSIHGGAQYIVQLMERLPESITGEDRLWIALAAYNVGLGHVFDARRLAEANGDSPDEWISLARWLPKLAEREWHSQTRFGYARGWEPVHLVTSVRSYFDWLQRLFPDTAPVSDPSAPPPELPSLRVL